MFQLIRDELLHGDGVPIGLVGAGINFTKLSYFWSPEMTGSLRSLFRGNRKYRKVQLGLFLLLAGLLALFAGPSCAVLLLPRKDEWPAGGTNIYLNGSKADFWPEQVTGSSTLDEFCKDSTGTRYGVCPSGGFHSIWSHYARLDHLTFENVVPPYANDLSGNRYYWPIESMSPVSAKVITIGDPRQKFMIQPHLSIVAILDILMQEWWPALLKKHGWDKRNIDDRQAVTSNVWTPNVHVECSPGEILSVKGKVLTFPTCESEPPSRRVDDVRVSTEPSDHLTFSWVSLPEFHSVSIGAVLQSPWLSNNNSRLVIPCSVRAQWTPAHLRTEAFTFWQGWYPKNITFDHSYPQKGSTLLDGSGKSARGAIAVDDAWLQTLTPQTPIGSPASFDWKPSTIESILSSMSLFDTSKIGSSELEQWDPESDASKYNLLASVIESVFVDGLSRYNIDRMYTRDGDPSHWTFSGYVKDDDFESRLLGNQDAVKKLTQDAANKIEVNFAISGLSYRNTLAQKLAMGVLFLHMAVAVLHIMWTVGRGKSSASWDSLTEIVVLAQNSKPANSLQNTCAGMKYSQTFAKKVSIRPTRSFVNGKDADHLELLVEEEEIVGDNELNHIAPVTYLRESGVTFRARNVSDVSQLSHSSTWPSHRHSSTVSIQSTTHEPPIDAISQPHTPLLASSGYVSVDNVPLRIRDDHAYG